MSAMTHPCRLFLVIPNGSATPAAPDVEAALAPGEVACALLRAPPDGSVDRALAETLCSLAQERDAAFLIESDIALARAIGADGVQIRGDEALYESARAALGAHAIIGAECGSSRHDALALAEKGADYIAVSGGPGGADEARDALVGWWAEIVEVPLVAGLAEDIETARRLSALGADFVAVEDAVWRHAGGPAQAVRDFAAALADRRTAA